MEILLFAFYVKGVTFLVKLAMRKGKSHPVPYQSFLNSPSLSKHVFCQGPANRMQHVDATSPNIAESLFGLHVARCWVTVEQSLISVKHHLHNCLTFLLFV